MIMKKSALFLILILFVVLVLGSYALAVDIVNFAYAVYLFFLSIYNGIINFVHMIERLSKL